MKGLRYLSVVVLLLVTALILRAHGTEDSVPVSRPLSQLPEAIAGWSGSDMNIDPSTLSVLGSGDFLSRLYARPKSAATIGLFIAYFPTQRTGSTIHSPKNCLPGAGWYFQSSRYVHLTDATGKDHQVGEYVVSDGNVQQFVIYWYFAHGRSVASEYAAKFYLVADAIRTDRTDGSLVRVVTPIGPNEGFKAAQSRAEGFTKQLMPMLPAFIPN